MRHRASEHEPSETPPVAGDAVYQQRLLQVEHAYQNMLAAVASGNDPAVTRRCSGELASALREAATTASRALALLRVPAAAPTGRRRHKATRTVSPEIRRWSVELVRLSRIAVWLRRTTLDELGVHLAAVTSSPKWMAATPHVDNSSLNVGSDIGRASPIEMKTTASMPVSAASRS
jgi:hypothetical protein